MKLAYRIALFCGLVPLVIAVFILAGWFFTNTEEFLIAGIFNILGGIVLFIIGISCLIFYEYQHRQKHQKSAWKKLLTPFSILVSNFPAAAGCIYLIIFMNSVSEITVHNQSAEMIPVIYLKNAGKTVGAVKGVMSRDTMKKYMRLKTSGSIDYSFEFNGRMQKGELIPYASRNRGSVVNMTISENGQVSVKEKRKRL